MKKLIMAASLVALVSGCSSLKYPGYEMVRIDNSVPYKSCVYRRQESCSAGGAKCYPWLRKRAIADGGDTVVITSYERGMFSHSSGMSNNSFGGWSSKAAVAGTERTMMADVYKCNNK